MIPAVSSFFASSYAASARSAILSLALILVASSALAQAPSLPVDDPLARLPADVILAVQVRSPRDFSPKLEGLLRQFSPPSAPLAFSFNPERFAGLDGARNAIFLLFDAPVASPLSFAFVVPVTDYDAFLRSDAGARISRLPAGVDEVARSAARKLYVTPLADARAAVCSSPDLALRLRDFSPDASSSLARFSIAPSPSADSDLTLILFPQRALPSLAPRLDFLSRPAGDARSPLVAVLLASASKIDLLTADLALKNVLPSGASAPAHAGPSGADLSLRIALRPLPDASLTRVLAAFSSAQAPEPASLWTDDTLACVTWNLSPDIARSNDLKELLLALYDFARPPSRRRGTASEPASVPADTRDLERDLFVEKALTLLSSFPGTGGASFLPGERPGELGCFLWQHCDDPTLDMIDRIAQHWLPIVNGLLARLPFRVNLQGEPSHPSVVYFPRAEEYLGRVSSVLSFAPPGDLSTAPARPRARLFGVLDAVCVAWNLPPSLAEKALGLLPRAPSTRPFRVPPMREGEPVASAPAVRLAASLRDLALACRPDSPLKDSLATVARNPATAGLTGPGLSASLIPSNGDLLLDAEVNLNDLALALSALSSLPEAASP